MKLHLYLLALFRNFKCIPFYYVKAHIIQLQVLVMFVYRWQDSRNIQHYQNMVFSLLQSETVTSGNFVPMLKVWKLQCLGFKYILADKPRILLVENRGPILNTISTTSTDLVPYIKLGHLYLLRDQRAICKTNISCLIW